MQFYNSQESELTEATSRLQQQLDAQILLTKDKTLQCDSIQKEMHTLRN